MGKKKVKSLKDFNIEQCENGYKIWFYDSGWTSRDHRTFVFESKDSLIDWLEENISNG